MLKNFEDFQKLGKDNVDVAMKQLGTVSKGWQTIATEVADYSSSRCARVSRTVFCCSPTTISSVPPSMIGSSYWLI